MNKRIDQLLVKAGAVFGGEGIDYSNFDPKKFAELFVQECIEQASIGNGHGNNQWDRALTFAAKNIKQHFGVEE
jgi:hypothetical protein